MTQQSDSILILENAAVGHGSQIVLEHINLALPRGSFTGLLGANGSGKSTLIRTILGILPPLGGRVDFVTSNAARPVLGYTPQKDVLDPIYLVSCLEVVLMGTCGQLGPGRRPGRAEREWALQCLCQTGAEQLSHRLFSELSGGQKQRVLIARALAAKPDFLLLDEPTSGIDAAARQAVMEVLRRIHEDRPLTILMASHDLPVVRAYMREVVWLHHGHVLHGPVTELLTAEKIEEILDLEMH